MFVSCVLCPREASRSRSLTIGRRLRELFVEPVLGGSLMGLLVHNLLSLEITEVVKDIIFRTSAVLVPSLDRVAPKHLKLITYASFSSFMFFFGIGIGRAVPHDLRLLCDEPQSRMLLLFHPLR